MSDVPLHHPADGPPPRSGEEFSPPLPTRATPRQATSAAAHIGPEPDEDDPLLAFAPYVHAAPRRNSVTPALQRRFVATLAATGIVKQAAKSIGRSLEALYKLRHRPGAEGFAAAWDAALERGVQRLEDCALERALHGTATPIVSHGAILGWWDKPDNNLLRFLLQHRLSQRYGVQKLGPGHPVYDSIRQQVLDEQAAAYDEDEVIASITAKLEKMKERQIAAERAGWVRRDFTRDEDWGPEGRPPDAGPDWSPDDDPPPASWLSPP